MAGYGPASNGVSGRIAKRQGASGVAEPHHGACIDGTGSARVASPCHSGLEPCRGSSASSVHGDERDRVLFVVAGETLGRSRGGTRCRDQRTVACLARFMAPYSVTGM